MKLNTGMRCHDLCPKMEMEKLFAQVREHDIRQIQPEKIVEIAKELGVDMIVMGTHAREGLDRLFFGSVANEVVKSAKCPVMTIRPSKKPE